MEVRKVQRTGDMHYIYLPTSWCKKYHISSNTKVSLLFEADGSLVISPQLKERKPKRLTLALNETNEEILHKLLVACFINPLSAFEIDLEKSLNISKLLEQKRIISLESVEVDEKKITYEGSLSVSDPSLLLKTMVRKVKNMLLIMTKNYNAELIEKYEEEIDRLKTVIDKSIITTLTYYASSTLTTIDLYYISMITKDIERMVDHLRLIPKKDIRFLKATQEIIDLLKEIIDVDDHTYRMNIEDSLEFTRRAVVFAKNEHDDFNKIRVRELLINVSEVLIDWAVTKEIETK